MSAERKVFGKLQGMSSPMPDLIDIQTKSYEDFLQADVVEPQVGLMVNVEAWADNKVVLTEEQKNLLTVQVEALLK